LIHARWICLTEKSTDLTPSGLGRTMDHYAALYLIIFGWLSFFLVDWVGLGQTYYSHPSVFTTLLYLHPPQI
jgi:hypothetical protein